MAGPLEFEDRSRDPARTGEADDPSTRSFIKDDGTAETVIPDSAAVAQDANAADELPEAFGRYRVLRKLGRGGMGSVWLGHDDELDRDVAIKVPHALGLETADARQEFLAEARTLAQLEHPRIIPVYDAGQTEDGTCYVVFKYVDGQTLRAEMDDHHIEARQATRLMADVADALHSAHRQGFVHRDIKPSNLLIDTAGQIWVADFGLAVAETGQRQLVGQVSGTPAYMAPEQTRGEAHHLDGRADIWSVGVILYELLTGRRPFAGDSRDELFAEISERQPRPLRMIDDAIPKELEQIALKCLEKSVTARYFTAHDLSRELRTWSQPARQRTGRLIITGTVVVGLLVAIFAAIVFMRRPDEQPVATVSSVPQATAQPDLAALVAEMRGLRRDLGETVTGPEVSKPTTTEGQIDEESSPNSTVLEPLKYPDGFQHFQLQIQTAREAGDENTESKLLLNATNELVDSGHFALAEQLAKRMVELAGNDQSDVPFAYGQLGLAQYRQGKYSEAVASYQRSEDIYRRLYDRMMNLPDSEQVLKFRSHLARLFGITLMRIGNVHKAAEDIGLARQSYEQSKELYERHNRSAELATLLLNYGGLESSAGNVAEAVALLNRGLKIVQEAEDPEEEAEFLVNLGNAYSRGDDNPTAIRQYEAALALLTHESDYMLRSALLSNWATSLLEEGHKIEARDVLRQLKSIARPNDADAKRVLEFLPMLEQKG